MTHPFISLIFLFIWKLRFPRFHSIATVFNSRYNYQTLAVFRKLETTRAKLIKAYSDAFFLTSCKNQNIFPKFLKFKLYNASLHNTNLYRSWQKTLLDHEIKTKQNLILNLDVNKNRLQKQLKEQISYLDFYSILAFLNNKEKKLRNNIKTTHNKKLQNLGASVHLNNCDPNKTIFNFSNRVLSSRESFLLSFGLNFGIPTAKPKFTSHFSPFESLATRLKSETISGNATFNSVCQYISNTANTLIKNAPKFAKSFFFTKSDYSLLKSLGKDPNLIITRPDKGKGVVLLNRNDYLQKMNSILSDRSKFSILPSSTNTYKLTLKLEDKINRFLRQLLDNKTINKDQYEMMRPTGSSVGTMYGLPKVHKTSTPLRPILAAYNSPSFYIAKFLVPLLEPLTTNSYTIKNSYTFTSDLSAFHPLTAPYMASFDIVSLFTNIPLKETLKIITDKLFIANSHFQNFDKSQFTKLLELACMDMHFIFNDRIYIQTDGVAMGSPIGPTLANIFMCHQETRWLEDCPTEFKPIYYRRYVDDTFLCFSSPDHYSLFLDYLNSKHENIRFTHELPINNNIPFLDLNITFTGNKFQTNIYRKPTFTGLGTNYNSYIFSKFKTNAIKTLLHRAYYLSSSFFALDKEIKFLKTYFSNNGYPPTIFDNFTNKFLNKIYSPSVPIITAAKKKIYHSLPFYGQDSEPVYNKLFSFLSSVYPHLNFKQVLKTRSTISSFFQFKDRVPRELLSNIIYKYSCEDCNASYIGSSRRRALERFHEHLGVSPRTGRHLTNPSFSHIRNHAEENNHRLSLNSFKIIDLCKTPDLCITESLYILQQKPSLNHQQTATPLFLTPDNIPCT